MMKKVKLVALSLLLVITSGVMVACKSNGKIPDPGGDFHYDTILVQLTEEASLIDRQWTPADFPEYEFLRIEDKGKLIGSRTFLVFYLRKPSRNNVLRAIYQLEQREEVYSARVNWIVTGGV